VDALTARRVVTSDPLGIAVHLGCQTKTTQDASKARDFAPLQAQVSAQNRH
jgi:hypothetical protein